MLSKKNGRLRAFRRVGTRVSMRTKIHAFLNIVHQSITERASKKIASLREGSIAKRVHVISI